jgi:hypothetical protein
MMVLNDLNANPPRISKTRVILKLAPRTPAESRTHDSDDACAERGGRSVETLTKLIAMKDFEIEMLKRKLKEVEEKSNEEQAWLQREADILTTRLNEVEAKESQLKSNIERANQAILLYKANEEATMKCLREANEMKKAYEQSLLV